VTNFSEKQNNKGSFGNANTNAVVVVTLCQLGINPDTDERFIKNGNSLLDALFTDRNTAGNGFRYGNKEDNEMARYQGQLALISAINVMETGKAYNVFDFTGIQKSQAHLTSNVKKEAEPAAPKKDTDITVYMTVKTPNGVWLPKTSVTVKEDALVYHAFTKALDDAGFTYVGAKKGYVSKITNAKGESLAEMDMGRNSGWLYKVGNVLPNVGLNEYPLNNGDNIVWYYVEDWTKDPDAVKAAGGKSAVEKWAKGQDEQKTITENPIALSEVVNKEEKTDASGNKAVIETDVNGKKASSVELSNDAAKTAKDTGKTVVLPVPQIKPQEDVKKADSVKLNLPEGVNKASVSFPIAEGDESTVIMKVNVDGSLTPIPTAAVSEDGKGLTAELSEGNYVVMTNKVEFTDVAENAWYAKGAGFTASHGLMVGMGDGTFAQNKTLTTAQTDAVIGRLKGENTSDSWKKAVEKHGTTQVNNRQNTISMLYEAYKAIKGETPKVTGNKTADFADAGSVAEENKEAMEWAIENDLIKGMGDNRLDPEGLLSRGQFGTMVERFVKILNGLKAE
nr:S-layer homology domain-containing protein [Clostridia bacterium]